MMEELNSFITSGKWFYVLDNDCAQIKYRAKILPHVGIDLNDERSDYYICALEALNRENTSMGSAFFYLYEGENTFLSSIFVKEPFRGQGIGSHILGVLEYLSTSLGSKKIDGRFHPTTKYADVFYAKNGYAILGQAPSAKIHKTLDYTKSFDNYSLSDEYHFCDKEQSAELEK